MSAGPRALKRALAPIVLLAALLLACHHAGADQPAKDGAERTIALQQRICSTACVRQYQACSQKPDRLVGLCNTTYVVCANSCRPCVGTTFAACVKADGATTASCQTTFVACMKTGLLAANDKRPLIRFEGGDGLSQSTAIVIVGALNEAEGIGAENLWVGKSHPDWQKSRQALLHAGGRSFDAITYDAPDGTNVVYFDISSFFGKL